LTKIKCSNPGQLPTRDPSASASSKLGIYFAIYLLIIVYCKNLKNFVILEFLEASFEQNSDDSFAFEKKQKVLSPHTNLVNCAIQILLISYLFLKSDLLTSKSINMTMAWSNFFKCISICFALYSSWLDC
jgi:hypothetical protein